MEGLKVWLNLQIAQILGDLQEREPVEDPSPVRAWCRIFFVVSLLVGFSLLLAYNFIDAPDAQVVQMHHVIPGDKNQDFPSCFLNDDRSSPKCTKWSKSKFPLNISVSCPCTRISAPWKNFVKFYILDENSTEWNMSLTVVSSPGHFPYISLPDDSTSLGNDDIVRRNGSTAEYFCFLSYLWTITTNYTNSSGGLLFEVESDFQKRVMLDSLLLPNCIWMASLLFPAPNGTTLWFPSKFYEDRTRSTQFLNTPSLLSREELSTHMAQLARDSVLSRRLALDMASSLNAGNEDFRRSYNALATLLTGLLDRNEMDPRDSYIYGAQELYDTLISNLFFDKKSMAWYLKDDSGPKFLQPEIDWGNYRLHCNPEYCEVNMPLRGARKLYWTLGILGGVGTIVLTIVAMLLWPCTAMLLLWISKRKTVEKREPRTPPVAFVAESQPAELSSPLDSKTFDSKSERAELSTPSDSKTLDFNSQRAELSRPLDSKTLNSMSQPTEGAPDVPLTTHS